LNFKPAGFVCLLLVVAANAATGQEVTFNRDVAPILFAKCATCHHTGEAAPFSLLSYDDAAKRAKQIAEVAQKGIMPPWPPAAGFGEFHGARRLSHEEIRTLAAWAAAGAPRGVDAD
jgi:mono/diheme cytochrome c family protein